VRPLVALSALIVLALIALALVITITTTTTPVRAELELTARGELAVAVVKASKLYPALNPYLDVIAFEASKTSLWDYALTVDDLRAYFELAKKALAVNDLERASHYVGAGLGALCDLIPHRRADEAVAAKLVEGLEAVYLEDPFSHLEELSKAKELSAKDFAKEYKSIALSVLERCALSPYERVLSDPQLSMMFSAGCVATALAFAVALYYRVKHAARKEEVRYEGPP